MYYVRPVSLLLLLLLILLMKRLVCVRQHAAWNPRRWGGQAVGDDFHGGTVGTVADCT